jgi:hypothetical protein
MQRGTEGITWTRGSGRRADGRGCLRSDFTSHNSTNPHAWFMLKLMAKNRQFFIIGHILLDLGLLGYVSGNTPLAYIGLIGSLIFFERLSRCILPKASKQNKLPLQIRHYREVFIISNMFTHFGFNRSF